MLQKIKDKFYNTFLNVNDGSIIGGFKILYHFLVELKNGANEMFQAYINKDKSGGK